MNSFWYDKIVDIFKRSTQNWTIYGGLLGLFQGTELVYFGGLLNFKYFWVIHDIHDIFWG